MGGAGGVEEDSEGRYSGRVFSRKAELRQGLCRQQRCCCEERGDLIGYDGHKKVKGSKIHAAVTQDALPLSVIVGEANEHDSRKLMPVVKGISVESGARPRKRPKELYADKAYDTFIVRWYLRKRRIKPQIPRRSRRRNPGRPPVFAECSYKKYRSSVERFFSMLKGGFRRLAIRYERLASTFMGLINIACFIIHWRVLR